MFLKFTETKSQDTIVVNTDNIVAVFTATESDLKGKTVINLTNGMVAVEESFVSVIGQLAAI
jgi:hypothetical protein